MKLNEDVAELVGMFAADGCLQDKYLCMWGNINEDKEYYDKIVCPLFSRIFKREIIAHEKKSNSVYGFYLCDKKVVGFFKKLGFTKNKTYDVSTPKEILNTNDKKILSSFIKGFLDCDGFITFMKRKGKYRLFKRKFNTYPRIIVRIVSKNMIKNLSYMLSKLDIKHTLNTYNPKQLNWSNIHTIEIRGIERVVSYINKVGFDNPAQYSKYEVWKKFGFCPPDTTIQQRRLILQDKLNPYSLY